MNESGDFGANLAAVSRHHPLPSRMRPRHYSFIYENFMCVSPQSLTPVIMTMRMTTSIVESGL